AWGGLAVLVGLAAMAVGFWHSSNGGDVEAVGVVSAPVPVSGSASAAAGSRAVDAAALAGDEAQAVATRQVSATELFRQYRESQGRAGEQYRQQRLGLRGTLASMEEGAEGALVLTLQAGPDLETIRAVITPMHRARALGLSPGTPVVLDCLHQGSVMGEPVLADCRLPR
ncbi:MAG: hypothetical protein EOP40_08115, partial [Rubrivivax sp.]